MSDKYSENVYAAVEIIAIIFIYIETMLSNRDKNRVGLLYALLLFFTSLETYDRGRLKIRSKRSLEITGTFL